MPPATLFSIPASGYQRIFAAELDVLAEDELRVRGRMRDHRFEFEHVWRLRTPAYEVVEASAGQLAGDEFEPALCARYANIAGVKIGRGFSKHVLAALGNAPGTQEHLLLAIEMARVGQQLYQYTPEFEARFTPRNESATEAARVAWLKDRAYMSDLANSCYVYRDATTELFDQRAVRCGFDASVTRPKPGDQRAFWRTKRLTIEQTDGAFICGNHMEDRIHDIEIGFALSPDGVITNAQSHGLRLPYHGLCEDPQQRTSSLNGLRITGAFIQQFAEHVGGAQGCTHLFDLSIDVLRLFKFNS